MKRIGICLMSICLLMVTGCMEKEWIQNIVVKSVDDKSYVINMKRDILCLMMAYPEYIVGIEKDKEGNVYVGMKSGGKILYDDKRKKGTKEKLNNPDIQDMMEQIYPLTQSTHLMDESFDPGRIRVYPLLKEVYGNSSQKIQLNLDNVRIGQKNYPFNSNNKAADSLKMVMKEISSLAKNKPQIYSFVYPASGTFNYRYIAGTNRLSAHSFGIAVDLKRDKKDYWKWASREAGEKRLRSYPKEIVRVFENNNFIWGGKWGHFDILHFEYRPELILKSRYFSKKAALGKPWYHGIGSIDAVTSSYIELIDRQINTK
ncbi:MAG: M15 family metallopeptidase [Maledivibacter sp.]|jgi:hypothetical protein|nr:M15 family metallopeptidase [Maledivibacter sp.]